jgi:Tfp pilus assembly protein PilW
MATPSPTFNPADEHGTTLIELLVAMVCAIVVLGALLTILEVSFGQETRIADTVQADQLGRTAMTEMVEELHSSCTGFGATAIQAPSTTPTSPLASTNALNLWFLSAYGNTSSGEAVLTGVTEHDINWTSTGESKTGVPLGTLTDYSFASTGGSSPNWVFPELKVANAKSKILAKNVSPLQVSKVSTMFQYAKYDNTSTDKTYGELITVSASEAATAAKNKEIARVTISFTQAPESKNTEEGRTAKLTDSVLLRFEGSETSSEAVNNPCA